MTDLIIMPKAEFEAIMQKFVNDLRADLTAQLRQLQPREIPDLMTAREAAAEIRVTVRTLGNYVRAGLIEKVHTTAGVRFRREDVEKMKSRIV